MDCSPPGSSIHGIFQARVLEWGAIALSEYLPQTYLMLSLFKISFIFHKAYLESAICEYLDVKISGQGLWPPYTRLTKIYLFYNMMSTIQIVTRNCLTRSCAFVCYRARYRTKFCSEALLISLYFICGRINTYVFQHLVNNK